MTNLKASSKRAVQFISSYSNAVRQGLFYLNDIFNSYSQSKQNAYEDCRKLKYKMNGFDFAVFNPCTSTFTAGFKYYDENKKLHIVIITKCNNYDIIAE